MPFTPGNQTTTFLRGNDMTKFRGLNHILKQTARIQRLLFDFLIIRPTLALAHHNDSVPVAFTLTPPIPCLAKLNIISEL